MQLQIELILGKSLRLVGPWLALASSLCVAVADDTPAPAAPAAAEKPAETADSASENRTWELSPYRMKWLLAVGRDVVLPPGSAERICRGLRNRAAALVGGAWRVEAEPRPSTLRMEQLADVAAASAHEIAADYPGYDKVMLLWVDAGPAGWRVAARELDVLTREWNSTVLADVMQPAAIERELMRAALEAFAPQARIDQLPKPQQEPAASGRPLAAGTPPTSALSSGRSAELATSQRSSPGLVQLRMRAAGISGRSPGLLTCAPGAFFRPVIVGRSADGALQGETSQPIPWTYLVVDKVDGGEIGCRLETGLKPPAIPDYHPAQLRLALGVTPGKLPTVLRLQTPGDPPRPLADFDVALTAGGSQVFLGRTDGDGSLTLPAGESPLRWLEVRHGDSLLLRLPFVAGLEQQMTLGLPDDANRVKLAAELTEFSDRLVDLVARREILQAEARAALAAHDEKAAEAALTRLRALPTASKLLEELHRIQSKPGRQATMAQPAVIAEFDALETLVKKHVTNAARQLEKDASAAAKAAAPAAPLPASIPPAVLPPEAAPPEAAPPKP